MDTLPRIPANVRSFEVRCKVGQFVMDGDDPGRAPDLAAVGGTVTITPDLRKPVRINGDDPLDTRVVGVNAIVFQIDPETGRLIHPDGQPGVELVDPNDPHLDPQGWTYTATVAPAVGNRWSVTFGAPPDGESIINIGGLAGVDVSPGSGGNPVQVAVSARDEAVVSAESAESAAVRASASASSAGEAATYAAEVAYGQPLGVTDATIALVSGDHDSQTRAALDRPYRRSVSVAEYGATGDGETDDTTAVQAALNANPHADVYFPPGTYRLTADLNVPGGTTVSGAGPSATLLDWSSKATWSSASRSAFMVWEEGVVECSQPLAADVDALSPSVQVGDGHDFQVGDIIRLTSDEEVLGEAVKAEFQRIVQIEGGTLHLSASTFDQYTAAAGGVVQRVNLTTGGLRGLSIRGKGLNPASLVNDGADANRGDNAVQVSFARDFRVSEVNFFEVENRCLRFDSVLGVTVTDTNFRFNPARVRLQYGISLNGATQMAMIQGCSSWNDRHMVTTSTSRSMSSGYAAARGIPRIIAITGCTAHGSWQDPIDTHRGGEYLTITGNAFTTEAVGVKARGTQILITGNVIVGKQSSVYSTGLAGVRILNRCQDVQVTGNLIRGFYEGIRFELTDGDTRALVVSENSILECFNPVTVSSSTPISELRIAGNTLRSAGGYPIFITSDLVDLTVTGNTLVGGAEGLRATHSSGQSVTRAVVQGNVCRGQSERAMFLRNISGGLVAGNFAPGSEIRFVGTCTDVIESLNHASVVDLSTPGITRK